MPAKSWKKQSAEDWIISGSSQAQNPGFAFLDSNFFSGTYGQYSVLAHDPFLIFEAKGSLIKIIQPEGAAFFQGEPLEVLENLLLQCSTRYSEFLDENQFFTPGAFGFLSYELGYPLQNLSCLPEDDLLISDVWFAFHDKISIYDHQSKLSLKFSIPENNHAFLDLPHLTKGKLPENRSKIKQQVESENQLFKKSKHVEHSYFTTSFTQGEYAQAFNKIMDHIKRGNIYQANLSQRFSFPFNGDPWNAYSTLRTSHPTALSACLNTGRNFILSASPELFLKKKGKLIETCPIKGTKLKPIHSEEEATVMNELLQSEKDRAEHLMIVDLERNDLGRVCETGSIQVKDLTRVETCGSVFHLVSTVSGKLNPKTGLREILRGVFPGGSITGAPKKKAMSIIAEIEPVVRGVYTGALGWIGFSGDFMFNLPIRTAVIQDRVAHVSVGGGIVADSTAEGEYQEILDKGKAFFELFKNTSTAI
jgi:para-aminobenzoate synthetase component 1